MTTYRPDPAIAALGDDFFDPVEPARFPECRLRFANESAAESVGLDGNDRQWWAEHFCRFEPLPDNMPQPLALRYHGHQFRVYNPEIGDGRGFTVAQVRDDRGRLLDLGTKGSGQTPYSRHADGRLTLKGGVREVLATEMLEALGVNTSKSFALFETGESLVRGDEPSPTRSAVLTRLSHGHIRIGTFQRLAYFRDTANMERLVRYCLELLYGEQASDKCADNAFRLFALASSATARLAASYLAAGFVHGVLNSDNINITGESFDYGPWRFTPYWDVDFVAAYFDEAGLYAFGRQPEAIHWDLAQLAGCLALLVDDSTPLADELAAWMGKFDAALVGALLDRMGVAQKDGGSDRDLAGAIVDALQSRAATIDALFYDWRGGRVPDRKRYPGATFDRLEQMLESRKTSLDDPYWINGAACSLHIDELEAIWGRIADEDDWSAFDDKVAAIRRMGAAMAADAPR